jgi:hypothetical protein
MIGHKKRLGAAFAALATAACLGALTPTPAQAATPAPVYWTFQNTTFGGNRCLTGGKIDDRGNASAFMSTCNRSNFQQWDWRGKYNYKQLQNKATGLCLTTDNKSDNNNAVWLSKCDRVEGERFGGEHFEYDGPNHWLTPYVNPQGLLHTAKSGAVYNSYEWHSSMDTWYGSHT